MSTTSGAVLNTTRSALSGIRSSFCTNLAPSASSWQQAAGASLHGGPCGSASSDMTLNRKTMPRMRAVVGTRMAATTSLMMVDCQ